MKLSRLMSAAAVLFASLFAFNRAQAGYDDCVYEAADCYRDAVLEFERQVFRNRHSSRDDRRLVDCLEDQTSRLRSAARHPERFQRLCDEASETFDLQEQIDRCITRRPWFTCEPCLHDRWCDVLQAGDRFVAAMEQYARLALAPPACPPQPPICRPQPICAPQPPICAPRPICVTPPVRPVVVGSCRPSVQISSPRLGLSVSFGSSHGIRVNPDPFYRSSYSPTFRADSFGPRPALQYGLNRTREQEQRFNNQLLAQRAAEENRFRIAQQRQRDVLQQRDRDLARQEDELRRQAERRQQQELDRQRRDNERRESELEERRRRMQNVFPGRPSVDSIRSNGRGAGQPPSGRQR